MAIYACTIIEVDRAGPAAGTSVRGWYGWPYGSFTFNSLWAKVKKGTHHKAKGENSSEYLRPQVMNTFYMQAPSWNLRGIKYDSDFQSRWRHTGFEISHLDISLSSASPWPLVSLSLGTSSVKRGQSVICPVALLRDLLSLAWDKHCKTGAIFIQSKRPIWERWIGKPPKGWDRMAVSWWPCLFLTKGSIWGRI